LFSKEDDPHSINLRLTSFVKNMNISAPDDSNRYNFALIFPYDCHSFSVANTNSAPQQL